MRVGGLLQRHRARLRSAFWNGIAGALPRGAMLLAGLYVAHRFGAEEYARYSLAFATFAIVGTLPGMTLTTVVSKFVPEFAAGDHADARAGATAVLRFAVVLAVIAGGGLLLTAPLLSQLFGVSPPIDGLLRSAAVAAACTIVAGASVGLLVGAGRFGASAAAYGLGFVLFAIAIVPLSAAVGPAGALFALAVLFAGTGAVAIARTGASLHDPSRSPYTAGRIRAVWNFFVPMLVAAGLVTPVMWLVNAFLARSAAPLDELSRFNAAYSWFAVLSFVPGVLAQVEFVAIAQARARGDTREMSRKLRRFVVQNALVMLPLALAIAALAPFLVGLYRLEGPLAERTLVLMAAAAFVASLGNPAGLFLSATDRTWIASALNLAWGLATIALCWLFREQGATGAALAFLVGYAVHCAIAILVAHVLLAREPRRPL